MPCLSSNDHPGIKTEPGTGSPPGPNIRSPITIGSGHKPVAAAVRSAARASASAAAPIGLAAKTSSANAAAVSGDGSSPAAWTAPQANAITIAARLFI